MGNISQKPIKYKWNWGAFFFPILWSLSFHLWSMSILMFIPVINFFALFILCWNGSKWAWQKNKKNFSSYDEFLEAQRRWAKVGVIYYTILFTLFGIVILKNLWLIY